MTDLEITKLCADAMGYIVLDWDKPDVIERLGIWCDDPMSGRKAFIYDPMGIRGHDPFDAQAMALVKKFRLLPVPEWDEGYAWTVFGGGITAVSDDLNRAICECVAKMQEAK